MEMVLSAVKKQLLLPLSKLSSMVHDTSGSPDGDQGSDISAILLKFRQISRRMIEECSRDDSNSPARNRKRKRPNQDQWTLHRDPERGGVAIVEESTSEIDQDYAKLPVIINHLREWTSRILPQIQSRILHAASPILHELSRQYFVPFLTVALACLGRIHSCILKLGRVIVGALTEFVPRLRMLSSSARRNSGTEGKIANAICGRDVCDELERSVCPTFTVTESKVRARSLDIKKGEEKIKAAGEWNALISSFLEVSHDDLTKWTNQFVKERRWYDMLSRFGLKDVRNENISVEEQSYDKEANTRGFFGYSSENQDSPVDSAQLHDIGKSAGEADEEIDQIENDTGEAIDEKTNTNTKFSNSDPTETVDDNMARILKLQKERSQQSSKSKSDKKSELPIEDQSGILRSSRKKKKKKKKSKKKKSGEVDNDGGDRIKVADYLDLVGCNTQDDQPKEPPDKNDVKMADSDADEMIVATSKRVPPTGMIVADSSEDIKPGKKRKKAKSEKAMLSKETTKKKKKRSSNVIDEIFG